LAISAHKDFATTLNSIRENPQALSLVTPQTSTFDSLQAH